MHFRRFTRAITPLLLFYAVALEYSQELLPRTQEYRNNGLPPSYFTTMVQLVLVLSTSIPLVVGRSYTILYLDGINSRGGMELKHAETGLGILYQLDSPQHQDHLSAFPPYSQSHLLPQYILPLRSAYCYNDNSSERHLRRTLP